MTGNVTTARTVWLGLLAASLLGPVAASVLAGDGWETSLWGGLASITGAQAVTSMAYALVVGSRLPSVTAAFGIDGVLRLHRAIGVLAVVLVLVHLDVVLLNNPGNVALLNPVDAPARAAAGVASLTALLLLLVLVTLRRALRMNYEVWRWGHLLLAVAALTFAALHVVWLDRLIDSLVWRALFAAAATAVLAVAALRWLLRPATAAPFMVRAIRPLDPTVSTVALAPLGPPPVYRAGQFAWLRLHRFATAGDHPFTMSSSPYDPDVEFTIRHRLGGWTDGPLRAIRPGRVVWLDGPHGAMTLDQASSTGIVLIAAGVGMAPMMSMLRTLDAEHDRRPVWLYTPRDHTLFADELSDLRDRLDLTVLPILQRPIRSSALAAWLPEPPVVRQLTVYVCGPPALVDDTVTALRPLGVPRHHVHIEQFDER